MTTITWKVIDMLRSTADGLVTRVGWQAVATDGVIESAMAGAVDIERGETFTPFEDLTEVQVLGWVRASPATAHVEQVLTARVAELAHHRATVSSGLPWVPPQA